MPASVENRTRAREDHALVVGISRYPKLGENYAPHDLDGPVNDAIAMTDWLVNTVGVPCENVFCITSDGSGTCDVLNGTLLEQFPNTDNRRPTQSDLMGKLELFVMRAVTARGRPGRIGRRLWVYMAGHGFRSSKSTRDVCILPADAYKVMHPKNFCATAWLDWVALAPPFDEVVLWLDCCSYTGYGIPPFGPPDPGQQLRDQAAKRLYVTAAEFGREAYEAPDTTGKVGGLFTRKLLSALRGAAKPSEGQVLTTTDLQGFFANDAGKMQAVVNGQTVSYNAVLLQNDDMEIVHLDPDALLPRSEIQVDWPAGTVLSVFQGWDKQVDQAIVGAGGSVEVRLPAGIYTLADAAGNRRPVEISPSENGG